MVYVRLNKFYVEKVTVTPPKRVICVNLTEVEEICKIQVLIYWKK